MIPLTPKQQLILDFLVSFKQSHGVAPRLEDVAKAFKMSGSGAFGHLKALEKKGAIEKYKFYNRGIKILPTE